MDAFRGCFGGSFPNCDIHSLLRGFISDNKLTSLTNQPEGKQQDVEKSSTQSNPFQQSFNGCGKNLYPNKHILKNRGRTEEGVTFHKNDLFPKGSLCPPRTQMGMEEFSKDNIPFQMPNASKRLPIDLKHQQTNKTPKSGSGKRVLWSLNETRDLVKLRMEMDNDFKLNKNKHQPLWEHISCVLNSLYPSCHRTASICCDKWKNTLREYYKLKHNGQPIEDYFKIIDMLENTKSNNPAQVIKARSKPVTWTLAETSKLVECRFELDPKFRCSQRYHKDIWEEVSSRLHDKLNLATSDKTPTVCKEKWRSILKECKLMKSEGKPLQGFMGLVQILAENCKCIVIQYGTQKHQIAIFETATADDIKLAIKSVCGLQNYELPFWLEDKNGIAQPIDKTMPANKVYNLRLVGESPA